LTQRRRFLLSRCAHSGEKSEIYNLADDDRGETKELSKELPDLHREFVA